MKILICGAGALGSNLTSLLCPDLKGEHKIWVLDKDTVEDRNIEAGTQFYSPEQVGQSKVEALQYNCYRWFQREIQIINEELTEQIREILGDYDLVIDCFDNNSARQIVQGWWRDHQRNILHVGFSDKFTFAIEWAEHYKVPSDITSGFDICQTEGASSFIKMVASVTSLVIQDFLKTGTKREFVGNRLAIREIK